MDEMDERIINILKKDARLSFVEIGKEVNLSEAAVRRRTQNLLNNGVIERFTIESSVNRGANAITLISVSPSTPTPSISLKLKEIKGVETVYEITGQYDIAVIISASNIPEINRAVDDIRRTTGVANTNTIIILKVIR